MVFEFVTVFVDVEDVAVWLPLLSCPAETTLPDELLTIMQVEFAVADAVPPPPPQTRVCPDDAEEEPLFDSEPSICAMTTAMVF
jgi:hypothetical protein